MIRNWIIALMLSLIAAFSGFAQVKKDPNFHIYILAGQSNMSGRGLMAPEFENEGNEHIYMLNKQNEWVLAKHPMNFDKPGAPAVGPGLSFAMKMSKASPNVKIGLIQCSVGGTPIESWLPGALDKVTKTHPYDDAVVRIKAAMEYGDIKGVIWHQGESNSKPEQVVSYLDQLKELIDRMRELSGAQNLPFVAGELGRYQPNYTAFNQEIIKLPSMVANTGLASSAGLVDKGDKVHFDAASARELGRRYAAEMIRIQKGLTK